MELIGLAIMTLTSLAISSALAATAFFFPRSRRFALVLLATPPAAVISLILIRWTVLDNSVVCGPDPEWDRCPSATTSAVGWAAWALCLVITIFAAYWAQRVLQAAIYLLTDRQPITLFGKVPKTPPNAENLPESEQ